MSGSVARPKVVAFDQTTISYLETQRAYDRAVGRNPWVDSRDALDIAGDLIEAAGDIGAAGNTLFRFPSCDAAIRDARTAARKVLALCARLEEIAS